MARKSKKAPLPFPIVAIGASAGGIEAFSRLLENLRGDLGMAYVFIQHLSPDHESFLNEILIRKTKMDVLSITNQLHIKPDKVYINLPGNIATLTDGKFHVVAEKKGQRVLHPIDQFMISLAAVYQQNAIGVVLSGTATDGTMGLKAIKTEGGITFAQDDTANFQGMPRNAVEMGYVDFVMSPEKIAKELATLIKHHHAVTTQNEFLSKHESELSTIHQIMHARRNVDFTHYKQSTIHRRIMRRMVLNRLINLNQYAHLLTENASEVEALYQDLLITVTNFFRDESLYNALTTKILPGLLTNRKHNDPLRIWIPGCATGEEAVSIAIVLLEFLGEKAITTPIQIFATDLNEKSIEKSRTGLYLKSALQHVSAQRLKKFFIKGDGTYQVVKAIRDICVFAPHNLLKDPPFSRMDIISCQNVLIYIEPIAQSRIMHSFHYALKTTGFLLLGKSETTGSAVELFEQFGKEFKIYRKKDVSTPLQVDFSMRNYLPSGYTIVEEEKKRSRNHEELDLEKETEKLLITRYTPASVLINKDLEILRFRGLTSRYLEPSGGKASLHLLKMVKDDFVFELRTLIHRAKKDQRTVKKDGLFIDVNGSRTDLTIEVAPIKGSGKNIFYLIVFKEGNLPAKKQNLKDKAGSTGPQKDRRMEIMERQLGEARDSMKVMNEEFESTREELQSANEEVLSSNEELQSINEELETSKEELQSTNEELTTINEELHNRNMELKASGDYADAIVQTAHESLIVLSDDLKVQTANKGFYVEFKSTPKETEGVYLYELGNNQWDIPELKAQLKEIQTGNTQIKNFEVSHSFPHIGLKVMLVNAQRVLLKDGKGTLILMAIQDITARKQMVEQLKESEEKLRLLIKNSVDIMTIFDKEGNIIYISAAAEAILGYTQAEREGKNFLYDSIIYPDDRRIKEEMIRKAVAHPEQNIYAEFRLSHKDGTYRTIDAVCKNQLNDDRINGIVATFRDITEKKLLEQQKDELIAIASHELKTPVTSIKAYTQVLYEKFTNSKDVRASELLGKMNIQIDRLNTLIGDLLDFTRIEEGKLKFRQESYDLRDLVKQVVSEMQRTTKERIKLNPIKTVLKVNGDRYRTGQVITNLLSNAVKFSPNGKKVVVNVKATVKDCTVSVQDFGIGIAKTNLKNLFDRFFQVPDPVLSTYPGLGLGLYIAAQIVRRQNGKIWVNSTHGKGSTFCFSLPRMNAVSTKRKVKG